MAIKNDKLNTLASSESLYYLGKYYMSTEINYDNMKHYLCSAIERGNENAMFKLSQIIFWL